MPNYEEGKIYKIVCNETGEVYVGSTTYKYLSRRLSAHKSPSSNTCSCKHIINRGNYDMVLIEHYPCNSKDELHSRERYWIENTKCVNLNLPIATEEEHKQKRKDYRETHKEEQKQWGHDWYENNKEHHRELRQKYQEEHKEHLLEKAKEYRDKPENKERQKETNKKWKDDNREAHLLQRKEYVAANKERIAAARKKHRLENRDKINEQKRLAYLRKKERESKIITT